MPSQLIRSCAAVCLLTAACALAQAQPPQQHPEAAKALEKIVQKQNFGEFKYDKHEVVTLKDNDRVPGLNGLMFVYYRTAGGGKIMLNVQWFGKAPDLQRFFDSQLDNLNQQIGVKQIKQGKHVVWSDADQRTYSWTDGKHFAVGMLGNPVPEDMVKAYLKQVPGRGPQEEQKPTQDKPKHNQEKPTAERDG